MTVTGVVTVLVPARNEERHIEACIEAVAAQDYPLDLVEVVVVDGSSEDNTAVVAKEALNRFPFGRASVVTNAGGSTPSNLNAGLGLARGDVVCRVDARSRIPPGYVRRCVEILRARPEIAVVGGAQVAMAPRPGAVGAGIARALNNRYTMGLSRYRRGAGSGPADTVYLGAFRADGLRSVGGWDVDLPTNQDFDLNRRLGRQGGVWFEAGLDVEYVPRSTLRAVFRQYLRFGRWKVRYWRHTGERPVPRQVCLLVAPPAVALLGAIAVMRSRPRRRRVVLLTGGVTAALGVVEFAGADRPPAGPAGHVAALVAMAATTAGWLLGVYGALLRPRWRQ